MLHIAQQCSTLLNNALHCSTIFKGGSKKNSITFNSSNHYHGLLQGTLELFNGTLGWTAEKFSILLPFFFTGKSSQKIAKNERKF